MFWKKLKKKATEKHNYDLTYDNVAIPEVHTHTTSDLSDFEVATETDINNIISGAFRS